MNRIDLLDKLKLVAPALSDNNLVPVLSHFWLLGDRLMAYNDQISISTSLKSDFKGAVPGSTLIDLLSASRAKDVELIVGKEVPEGQLLIKAASSRLKLPYLPSKATELFTMPKPDPAFVLDVSPEPFLAAIESCLRSVREDTSIPDSLGITIIPQGKFVDMYATNDATISHSQVKLRGDTKFKDRVILSGAFCRQMLSLATEDKASIIEIHDDYSLFKCGDTILFGRLVNVEKPLDFASIIDTHFSEDTEKNLITIPTKLQLILDRAVIITESKSERSKTAVSIKDGKALFYSKSDKGEVRDSMLVEQHHPDVDITIEPKLMQAGFGHFDKMVLSETCVVMIKDNSLYLISASQ